MCYLVKRLLSIFMMIGISCNVYAYFCSSSKGHGYINIGDTMQQVQAICGVPDSRNSNDTGGSKLGVIEYWTYTTQPLQTIFGATNPKNAVNEPPAVTFEIIDNKVVSITTNSKQVQSSSNCTNRKMISVGDSADNLKRQCGSPTVTRTENKVITTPKQKIETWTYNVPSGASIVLQFTNGVLTKTE